MNHPPKKRALLVVSFGTSFASTRKKTISATENALAQAFPAYEIRRAFSSHVVINKLKKRDNISVDTVPQALDKLLVEGFQEVLVQPLQVICGTEYHLVLSDLTKYEDKFAKFAIGFPLLTHYEDYITIVDTLRAELPACGPDEAVILMGHGSHHPANASYLELDYVLKTEGMPNVFVATVEGFPPLESVIKLLEAKHVNKVTLMPLMLVAGDHAQNDMAGDEEDSWKSILEAEGFKVETRLIGLGEIEKIRQMYVAHARAAQEIMNEG